jgi:adenylosuccinate synthase
VPGWSEDLTELAHYEELPGAARRYVELLEKLVGVPIALLSVGPERDQIVTKRDAPRLLEVG